MKIKKCWIVKAQTKMHRPQVTLKYDNERRWEEMVRGQPCKNSNSG